MDADNYTVEVVLKEDRRFLVPIYQRKYRWTDDRLLPFWEDVQAKAAEVLSGESRFEHYMGALIIAPVDIGSQIGKTPVVQVVDGQQRLTTFQLFLAALREVARRQNLLDLIDQVNGYLFNKKKTKDTDPLAEFKLTPTMSDRILFHDLMKMEFNTISDKYREFFWGKNIPKNTEFPALRAYFLFNKWIEEFAINGPSEEAPEIDDQSGAHPPELDENNRENINRNLEALLDAVLERLKLVVISLGENDDAQVIFETLNSKGEPLLAMDLVRNNIFHRAEKQGAEVEDLYRRLWDPFDEKWWHEAAPNARPMRPRIDHFLAHTLAAATGKKISMRELYAEYRAFAVPKGRPYFQNIEDELRLLERYAPIYETLEGRKAVDADLAWFGRKMEAWQTTTVYPVALQLFLPGVDQFTRKTITKLLYSYIVRRVLCGLTTKNLNNIFQSMAARFVQDGVSVHILRSFFDGRDGDSIRFPGDAELKSKMLTENAYGISPQPRLVDILWELEETSRSQFAEKHEQPKGLSVEHVLPRVWTEEWPFLEADYAAPDSDLPQAQSRRAVINTLGNLTLVTGGLNSSVGNKSFSEKKSKFALHTGLFLNKWFADQPRWTEHEIRQRGEHFADIAIGRWPSLAN